MGRCIKGIFDLGIRIGYLVRMRLSCNFVNVNTIAYRVHVYTRTSVIYSPNPNPDSSNRISPVTRHTVFEENVGQRVVY